ncbi:MAG: DUF2442 domain-containing protein [Candidatus Competibacteraceae bacterium]|nr:DUF2442 domain-containing protein [Candidatus Competibacteraceae bacterium]MBK8754541.1 DUF2442 domain-containing protein [Candidatus Competibacteraceae bacterium]
MSQPPINIVAAESVGECRLRLLFDDGIEQTINFKPFLAHAHHPDLRVYLDPAMFSTFRIEYGDLVWGDYDLCFPIIDLYRNQLEHNTHQEAAAA